MLTTHPSLAPDGAPFTVLTLTNAQGMRISLMDWGATPGFPARSLWEMGK